MLLSPNNFRASLVRGKFTKKKDLVPFKVELDLIYMINNCCPTLDFNVNALQRRDKHGSLVSVRHEVGMWNLYEETTIVPELSLVQIMFDIQLKRASIINKNKKRMWKMLVKGWILYNREMEYRLEKDFHFTCTTCTLSHDGMCIVEALNKNPSPPSFYCVACWKENK